MFGFSVLCVQSNLCPLCRCAGSECSQKILSSQSCLICPYIMSHSFCPNPCRMQEGSQLDLHQWLLLCQSSYTPSNHTAPNCVYLMNPTHSALTILTIDSGFGLQLPQNPCRPQSQDSKCPQQHDCTTNVRSLRKHEKTQAAIFVPVKSVAFYSSLVFHRKWFTITRFRCPFHYTQSNWSYFQIHLIFNAELQVYFEVD